LVIAISLPNIIELPKKYKRKASLHIFNGSVDRDNYDNFCSFSAITTGHHARHHHVFKRLAVRQSISDHMHNIKPRPDLPNISQYNRLDKLFKPLYFQKDNAIEHKA
jgi:hypothetical protein